MKVCALRQFVDELCAGLIRCRVHGERVLVAVSGGADSVALLRGLVGAASKYSLELCVAHLNHRLRGADSHADANWVRELASSMQLPCEIGVVADGALAAERGGMEETARKVRYQFLHEAALKWNCHTIALAHTADDQCETVLHRFFRGTGISGLKGMSAVRFMENGHRLVRPMLSIRRSMVEDYLLELGQEFRTDASNINVAMTRNRLRHVILPLLRGQINPQVDSAICRLADQAMEAELFVHQYAERLLDETLMDFQCDSCRLNVLPLTNESRYLVGELFRQLWLRQNWPLQAMGFEQWTRLVDTIQTRATITLPNRIEARYHSETLLVLRRLSDRDD